MPTLIKRREACRQKYELPTRRRSLPAPNFHHCACISVAVPQTHRATNAIGTKKLMSQTKEKKLCLGPELEDKIISICKHSLSSFPFQVSQSVTNWLLKRQQAPFNHTARIVSSLPSVALCFYYALVVHPQTKYHRRRKANTIADAA